MREGHRRDETEATSRRITSALDRLILDARDCERLLPPGRPDLIETLAAPILSARIYNSEAVTSWSSAACGRRRREYTDNYRRSKRERPPADTAPQQVVLKRFVMCRTAAVVRRSFDPWAFIAVSSMDSSHKPRRHDRGDRRVQNIRWHETAHHHDYHSKYREQHTALDRVLA